MGSRKVIDGITSNARGLSGSQTTGRRMSQQFGLRGGLNNNSDITLQAPSEWLNCTNARIPALNTTAFGGIVNTLPPVNVGGTPGSYADAFTYAGFPQTVFVANLNNTILPAETYVESGTGTTTLVNTNGVLSQSYVQFSMTTGQTCTHTATLPQVNLGLINITTPILSLAMENLTGYASGYIRIGTDASNYRQWNFTQTDTSGSFVPIKFLFNSPSSTTGSWNPFVIEYAQVSITANSTVTTKFVHLTIANFTSVTTATKTFPWPSANINSAYPYVYLTQAPDQFNQSDDSLIANVNNALYNTLSNDPIGSADNSLSFMPMFDGFYSGSDQSNFNFCQFPNTGATQKNTLYFANGQDGVFSVDFNATVPTMAKVTSTKYKYIVSYQNYMWYAGDPANPNTLVPSIIATPGTLDTSNALVIDPGNGQNAITGMVSMDTYLIIFRTNDIWILTGNTTGLITAGGNIALQKTMATVGAYNQNCIARIGSNAYFFNGRALYSFNGNQETLISEKINLSINGTVVSPFSVSLAYNSAEEALYIMCGPGSPSRTTPVQTADYDNCGAFIFNPTENNWSFIGGTADALSVYLGGFTYVSPADGIPRWYTYGLYFLTQAQTNGLFPTSYNQNFLVQSSWNNLGMPFIQKDPAQIRLFITSNLSSAIGTLKFYTDFVGGTVAYTTTFTIPQVGSTPYVELNIGPGCQGHAFSVEIDSANTQSNFYNSIVYSGYAISYTEAEVI
jgi:hypothetical protein